MERDFEPIEDAEAEPCQKCGKLLGTCGCDDPPIRASRLLAATIGAVLMLLASPPTGAPPVVNDPFGDD